MKLLDVKQIEARLTESTSTYNEMVASIATMVYTVAHNDFHGDVEAVIKDIERAVYKHIQQLKTK